MMLNMLLAVTHPVNLVLVPYTPQTAAHAQDRCRERHPVRRTITQSSLETLHIASLILDRMIIIYPAVQYVENIARYHRRKGHCPPILAETMHTKAVRHETGKDAK